MSGWITLHRKISDNKLWRSERFTRGQAWVDLLLLANHEYGFYFVRDIKVEVQRSQVGRSIKNLSTRWKWSRTKTENFLKLLKREHQVDYVKTPVTTIITIKNYDYYQKEKQQKSNKKATEEQQEDINNNKDKENNDNIIHIVDYLNQKTDKKFKATTAKTRELIIARINDGFTLDDFKRVIDNKVIDWLNEPNWNKFLRPETLFSNKFESYLNQNTKVKESVEYTLDDKEGIK